MTGRGREYTGGAALRFRVIESKSDRQEFSAQATLE
jgi:hypothetical protein